MILRATFRYYLATLACFAPSSSALKKDTTTTDFYSSGAFHLGLIKHPGYQQYTLSSVRTRQNKPPFQVPTRVHQHNERIN
ncbi:hypothetical protein IF1G_05782 [Cordyceps javanica]|uniref:Secreted protein n=1 Tax=Cordyceps javanica TaxID=43265 RepID=A0A545V2M5_9HYPO|nr:hypothetical protein IF1G_05782 [Cordyceps javanica]